MTNEIHGIKGIIWDLDGTLLDSFKLYTELIGELVVDHGLTMPTREHIEQNFHGSLEDSVRNTLGLKSDEQLAYVMDDFLRNRIQNMNILKNICLTTQYY